MGDLHVLPASLPRLFWMSYHSKKFVFKKLHCCNNFVHNFFDGMAILGFESNAPFWCFCKFWNLGNLFNCGFNKSQSFLTNTFHRKIIIKSIFWYRFGRVFWRSFFFWIVSWLRVGVRPTEPKEKIQMCQNRSFVG